MIYYLQIFYYLNELQNEFLSQSLDSVELNVDYSKYENFINFGSVEKELEILNTN